MSTTCCVLVTLYRRRFDGLYLGTWLIGKISWCIKGNVSCFKEGNPLLDATSRISECWASLIRYSCRENWPWNLQNTGTLVISQLNSSSHAADILSWNFRILCALLKASWYMEQNLHITLIFCLQPESLTVWLCFLLILMSIWHVVLWLCQCCCATTVGGEWSLSFDFKESLGLFGRVFFRKCDDHSDLFAYQNDSAQFWVFTGSASTQLDKDLKMDYCITRTLVTCVWLNSKMKTKNPQKCESQLMVERTSFVQKRLWNQAWKRVWCKCCEAAITINVSISMQLCNLWIWILTC